MKLSCGLPQYIYIYKFLYMYIWRIYKTQSLDMSRKPSRLWGPSAFGFQGGPSDEDWLSDSSLC